MQVTDATERAMQIRVLVTARSSSDLWDLRCFVREGILAHIRDHQPHAFPRVRVELPSADATPAETERRVAKAGAAVADGQNAPPKTT